MSDRYRLVCVKDAALLTELTQLVRPENENWADVLAHLAEVEDRMLHLELGFASLFAYCVEKLNMSEGAAGRRVAAARVCRRFPEAFALVAAGELHLLALCALGPQSNRATRTICSARVGGRADARSTSSWRRGFQSRIGAIK